MSFLPDELWRRILEIGTENSSEEKKYYRLNYKDLCCLSISCRRLRRLSSEDAFWSPLLSSDFPLSHHHASPSSSSSSSSSTSSKKALYRIRFERDRARKLAAHRRAVLRVESQVAERSRKLLEIESQLSVESDKMREAASQLSNLNKVRQASVALNVWQPEVVRGRQKQIVEQCAVPVDNRISALEMELKLCKQQIRVLNKTYRDENRRLDSAKEQLASIKYHPLRDYNMASSELDASGSRRKKLKKSINSCKEQGKTSNG